MDEVVQGKFHRILIFVGIIQALFHDFKLLFNINQIWILIIITGIIMYVCFWEWRMRSCTQSKLYFSGYFSLCHRCWNEIFLELQRWSFPHSAFIFYVSFSPRLRQLLHYTIAFFFWNIALSLSVSFSVPLKKWDTAYHNRVKVTSTILWNI